MKRGILPGLVLPAVIALAGCIGGEFGLPFRATVDESRPLAANGSFSLENTNGEVKVVGWEEARVRVEAVKRAGSERALEELKVEIVGEGDRLSVRTRHPRGGFFGRGGQVDYRVSVPRAARVRVENVNGRVEIEGVEGALEASTVNGSLSVAGAAGAVDASSVNGGVDVDVARVDPAGRSRLKTTNGTVRLALPRDASADVEASTVNGAVACDFDLADAQKGRRRIEGRIGQGGARFELGTVNGTVNVERAVAAAATKPPAEAAPEPKGR